MKSAVTTLVRCAPIFFVPVFGSQILIRGEMKRIYGEGVGRS